MTKAWKLAVGDWIERRSWDDYIAAYDDALSECSTEEAPCASSPPIRSGTGNLAIAQLLADAMRPYKAQWLEHLDLVGQREVLAIKEARAAGTV
ncbi:MAG: hypothetical protein U0841_16220 [Chloroflexia bacterium]